MIEGVQIRNMGSDSQFRDRFDVAGTGLTVVDRIYADGSLADEALGGSCGNVLVSLDMLRRNVVPVLTLGDDDEGRRLLEEFARAGAVVDHIHRKSGTRSPVIAQELDTSSGQHDFSFVCPETSEELPRYLPIGDGEVAAALHVFTRCSVFYADRLSVGILDAMKAARRSGAIVFFEPSDIGHDDLFAEALGLVSILKYSSDRLREWPGGLRRDCVRIVTHGAAGLEIRHDGDRVWCSAVRAPTVLDTCGSGDMVSVGIIDWMLATGVHAEALGASVLLEGVVAGQRLAAANCAFAGARGLFKHRGPGHARMVLRAPSDGYSAADR
jgi:fructokinase